MCTRANNTKLGMLNLVFDGWWVAGILWKNGYIVGFVLSNGLCLRGFVGGFYLGENGGGGISDIANKGLPAH